jgi:cytochrome b6
MNSIPYKLVFRRLSTIVAVGILTLSFLAAISGILLAFYYQPAAGAAFRSLEYITTQVPYGAIVRSLHEISGNGIIILGLIQIVVMFLGEWLHLGWIIAWISGIALTMCAIALSWTAMILDWSQLGYWRFRVELGTIEAIPLIGALLRDLLTGGGPISTLTVEHLYTLHSYLLSLGALVLAVMHLGGLLLQARTDAGLKQSSVL